MIVLTKSSILTGTRKKLVRDTNLRFSIAQAASETDVNPTDKQKEAENYRKGKFRWNSLEIAIENPRGSTRSGTDNEGKEWSIKMKDHYGYIKQQPSGSAVSEADGDHIDVFMGSDPESELIYVVDQVFEGKFDEHKCMLGYVSEEQARNAYKRNYEDGWEVGELVPLTLGEFLIWLEEADTSQPAKEWLRRMTRHKKTLAVEAFDRVKRMDAGRMLGEWVSEDVIEHVRKASECGANQEGGGGFTKGNSCAGDSSSKPGNDSSGKPKEPDKKKERTIADKEAEVESLRGEWNKEADKSYEVYKEKGEDSDEFKESKDEVERKFRTMLAAETAVREEKESIEKVRFDAVKARFDTKDSIEQAASPILEEISQTGMSYNDAQEKYGEEKVSESFRVARAAKDEWEAKIKYDLSMGNLTDVDARALGASLGSRSDKYEPLPEKLYHATTDLSSVLDTGLKTRDELTQGSGKGLGGGTSDTISFTADRKTAEIIEQTMREANLVANDKITIEDLRKRASDGIGADKPYLREVEDSIQRRRGDELPQGVKDSYDGTRYSNGNIMSGAKPDGEHDWKPAPDSTRVWESDGETRSYQWIRPATADEKQRDRWQYYKASLFWREQAGGQIDPLFFSTDVKGLAAMDPNDFGVIEVKPSVPEAQGYQVSALGEWRTHTGDATEVVGATRDGEEQSLAKLMRYYEGREVVRFIRKASECGANQEGGGGFKKGNSCAGEGGGDSEGTKEDTAEPKQDEKDEKAIQTASPEFKSWFGDSKVVDENGEPLVVYHGTNETNWVDINEFKPNEGEYASLNEMVGTHFAVDPKIAGRFAEEQGGSVFPVYLSVENPREITNDIGDHRRFDQTAQNVDISSVVMEQDEGLFTKWAMKSRNIDETTAKRIYSTLKSGKSIDEGGVYDFSVDGRDRHSSKHTLTGNVGDYVANFDSGLIMLSQDDHKRVVKRYKEILGDNGFDGVVYQNNAPGEVSRTNEDGRRTYVVFEPSQVKSSSGNTGKFNPDDPDITKTLIEQIRKASECGANQEGGGGFKKGNTCAGEGEGEGKSGELFVSPNTGEDMAYRAAIDALSGDAQKRLRESIDSVGARLGMTVESRKAVGVWSDGTENSEIAHLKGFRDFEEMRYFGALMGLESKQKDVLIFQHMKGGVNAPNSMYTIHFDGGVDRAREVRDTLNSAGFEYQTHEIKASLTGGMAVHIIDTESSPSAEVSSRINKIGERFNGRTEVKAGRAEFITGFAETREAARSKYEETITQYRAAFPGRPKSLSGRNGSFGHQVGRSWRRNGRDDCSSFWSEGIVDAVRKLSRLSVAKASECGANTTGGGGFTSGNTCASGSSEPTDKELSQRLADAYDKVDGIFDPNEDFSEPGSTEAVAEEYDAAEREIVAAQAAIDERKSSPEYRSKRVASGTEKANKLKDDNLKLQDEIDEKKVEALRNPGNRDKIREEVAVLRSELGDRQDEYRSLLDDVGRQRGELDASLLPGIDDSASDYEQYQQARDEAGALRELRNSYFSKMHGDDIPSIAEGAILSRASDWVYGAESAAMDRSLDIRSRMQGENQSLLGFDTGKRGEGAFRDGQSEYFTEKAERYEEKASGITGKLSDLESGSEEYKSLKSQLKQYNEKADQARSRLDDLKGKGYGELKISKAKDYNVETMSSTTSKQITDAASNLSLDVDGIAGVARLSGLRDNVDVRIESDGENYIMMKTKDGYENRRVIQIDDDGQAVLHNEVMIVDPDKRGKGIGTEVFARQVQAAKESGISYIATNAHRAPGWNGYYTWPRLGYDADIPYGLRGAAPGGAERLSDLMATSEGRTWWKENGQSIDVEFDLSDGSLSMEILDAYLTKKGMKRDE